MILQKAPSEEMHKKATKMAYNGRASHIFGCFHHIFQNYLYCVHWEFNGKSPLSELSSKNPLIQTILLKNSKG